MRINDFIDQVEKLRRSFPEANQLGHGLENCDYCDELFNSKGCFQAFNSSDLQDCLYCNDGYIEKNDIDCLWGVRSERCYECTDFADCTDCNYLTMAVRCYNMWGCDSCYDCHDCFGSTLLRNKSYCIYNIQHTKEEYEKKISELKKTPIEEVLKRVARIKSGFPKINLYYDSAENSDFNDYIYFVKNLYYCFDSTNSEDCGYMNRSNFCKDTWDDTYGYQNELCIESNRCSNCHNSYFIEGCERCFDTYFSYKCKDCHDCFGCVRLANKSYCILNIQYTKEEYENRISALRDEFGVHFTNDLSVGNK